MSYTAAWVPPANTAAWPAPPATVATVQAIGDTHFNPDADGTWSQWPAPNDNTTWDHIGADLDDRMLKDLPDAAVQVGDAFSQVPVTDHARALVQQQMVETYKARYGLDWWMVMGNHDIAGDTLTPDEWAALWGYTDQQYTADLGSQARLVVVGGDDNLWTESNYAPSVAPLTPANLSWLDAQLAADTRPTIIAAHAPLVSEPTVVPPADWWEVQSTVDAAGVHDVNAAALLAILDAHPHVIGWVHGHTHNRWDSDEPNLSAINTGTRSIVAVDCGFTYQTFGSVTATPVSYWLSVLDDGKTIETRWRHHAKRAWASVPGLGRVERLAAT